MESQRQTRATRRVINPPAVFDSVQYGFSQAVEVAGGRRILLSGQVGVDADERTVGTTLEAQLRRSFDNIAAVLEAAGAGLEHVAMLRIYLVDSVPEEEDDTVVAVLRERFPVDPPASSWVRVSGLSVADWLVEVEAEAFV